MAKTEKPILKKANMITIYGLIGFGGYELLKWYNRIWGEKQLIPKDRIVIYFIIIILLALFSSFLAAKLAPESVTLQIFIGFSVPSNVKVVKGLLQGSNSIIESDDVEIIANMRLKADHHFSYYFNLIF